MLPVIIPRRRSCVHAAITSHLFKPHLEACRSGTRGFLYLHAAISGAYDLIRSHLLARLLHSRMGSCLLLSRSRGLVGLVVRLSSLFEALAKAASPAATPAAA